MAFALLNTAWALVCCVYEIICIWRNNMWNWLTRKSRADLLLQTLGEVKIYEEWRAAAFQLDECLNYDLWRQNSASKYYDYRLIHRRLTAFYEAEDSDILSVINLIRTGLVRNLGNITSSRLYNRAYGGTKLLIEDYIDQVVRAIASIVACPTDTSTDNGFTPQVKLDVLHDTRLAFGRSVLVLQGGAIFGLCHLGVVKALLLRGLLPRIIAGTATGAIIAALVCVHKEDELFDICNGRNIDITAFTNRPTPEGPWKYRWLNTLQRRVTRWWKEGHFLDVGVLERLLRDNIGDMTFEEAYERTRRVLNITVSTSGGGGVPNVLNYISAPNVLIWSAALASNATSSSALYRPVTVLCKDIDDEIVPWFPATQTTFRHWSQANYRHRESPLHRIGELFNVNHYIVSQARPYLVPFLRSDLHHPHPKQARMWRLTTFISRLTVLEIQHRLHQLNTLGWLSPSIRRFLLDESVPGSSLTLVPELTPTDFGKLLENPSKETVDYWVLKGERSVWPALSAIKSRVAIEIELDKAYQTVRRRKPSVLISASATSHGALRKSGSQGEVNRQRGHEEGDREERLSRRKRAKSFGDGMGLARMT